jgi:hypothetical protein
METVSATLESTNTTNRHLILEAAKQVRMKSPKEIFGVLINSEQFFSSKNTFFSIPIMNSAISSIRYILFNPRTIP